MPPVDPEHAEKLIESGLALSAELSTPSILQRIVNLAVELTGATYGALGVLGPDGSITEFLHVGMTEEEREAVGPYPSGKGILGALLEHEGPLRLDDLGSDPRSVGFPPNHPPMGAFLGAPIRCRGMIFGNIYLTEKQGGFSDEDESALTVLAAQAGIAIDNSRQYEETRRRERSLASLREITDRILGGAGPDEVLELIADRARELVGTELATIAVPTSDTGELVIQVASGAYADQLRGQTFPMEGSVTGEVITSGQPTVIGDLRVDERTHQPTVRFGELGPSVFVPLSVAGTAFGTLTVANLHKGQLFGDDDLKLLETFAAHAAVAIEYARAQEEVQRLAIMEDRERIAKDLHDGAIQSLFAVGMGLDATGALSEDAEVQDRLEQAAAEVDRVIRDLRNYIFGLRPGILADRQLHEALVELGREFGSKSEILTVTDIDEGVAAELAGRAGDLVQLTREALSNIGRHSDAETCSVKLRGEDGIAVLEIDDDGQGFDVDASIGSQGHGLRNIRERAESLGGTASISSSLTEGTTIRISIPLG